MDMRELYTQIASQIFTLGKTYSYGEINEEFLGKEVQVGNVTALTYNRWNKGMSDICPLFEYLDRNTYKYIGPIEISRYTGNACHFPQGQNRIHQIGSWNDGFFTFSNPAFLNFIEWKASEDNGIQVIGENSIVTFQAIDGSITQTKELTEDTAIAGTHNGRHSYILTNSPLGTLLMNKSLKMNFIFGGREYIITQID